MIEAAASSAAGSRFSATQNVVAFVGVGILLLLLLCLAASYQV